MLNTLEYYSEWAGGARIPREVFRIPEAFFIHAEKAHHFLTDSMLKDAAAALVAFMAPRRKLVQFLESHCKKRQTQE